MLTRNGRHAVHDEPPALRLPAFGDGTRIVEFLVSDDAPDEFFFMEINTRLPLEPFLAAEPSGGAAIPSHAVSSAETVVAPGVRHRRLHPESGRTPADRIPVHHAGQERRSQSLVPLTDYFAIAPYETAKGVVNAIAIAEAPNLVADVGSRTPSSFGRAAGRVRPPFAPPGSDLTPNVEEDPALP